MFCLHAISAEIACKQNIQVFMSSILPVFRYPWNKSIIEPFKKIAEINNFMKDFSNREKLVYVDYHSHMVDSRPGVHHMRMIININQFFSI